MNLIVVADTGAIISLVLSGLFRVCKKHFRIIIGGKIAEELKEIFLEDDEIGKAAKEALNEIEIVSAGKKFDIGEGFVKKHRNNEKISFSVVLMGILMERKIISKIDFLNAVNAMFGKRRWEENLIYLVAKNMLEED